MDIPNNEDSADFLNQIINFDQPTTNAVVETPIHATVEDQLSTDFDIARTNLTTTAEIATEALELAGRLAQQMQEPKAIDALSKIITAAVAANKALVELHKNRKEGKDSAEETTGGVINHNYLVMSTAEMLQQLEDARAERQRDT